MTAQPKKIFKIPSYYGNVQVQINGSMNLHTQPLSPSINILTPQFEIKPRLDLYSRLSLERTISAHTSKAVVKKKLNGVYSLLQKLLFSQSKHEIEATRWMV